MVNGIAAVRNQPINIMTYYESAEGETMTRARAYQELDDHGVIDREEFIEEMGRHDTYDAQEVLDWLGY